jgi:ABC-type multidrug transport system permease subunit
MESSRAYWPLWHLVLSRLRLFLREPAAIFWVYGFPILMLLSLGVAFRDDPTEEIAVDVVLASGGRSSEKPEPPEARGQRSVVSSQEAASSNPQSRIQNLKSALAADKRFNVKVVTAAEWPKRPQSGRTDLVIEETASGLQFWDEPRRAESRLARYAVEAILLRSRVPASGGRSSDHSESTDASRSPEVKHLEAPGSRYIDFLLPGLIGMGLMGGGMWGVGFVIVDLRVRKLLKRFLATPMRRTDFLLAVMISRLIFTVGDVVVLMAFGYWVFGVRCQGSYVDLTAIVLLGGAAFAGIGLLVASRAQTVETVSGLMNLVILPMWVLSGVFFSSERFPQAVQPAINLLPLTALNQALRGVMLEGKSLAAHWPQLTILALYATLTFAIALRIFRWR